jgi:hypothetical protein
MAFTSFINNNAGSGNYEALLRLPATTAEESFDTEHRLDVQEDKLDDAPINLT